MTDELKPCPFCGGEAASFEDGSHSTAWEIGCYNGQCAAEPSVWELSKARAITAWNTRALAPPRVLVRELVWKKQSYKSPEQIGHHSNGYSIYESAKSGKCVVSSGSPFFFGPIHTDTLETAKAAAQADYEARVMAALEPTTPRDDPRVKALVDAAKEVKADCIARADKNGVVPIGRGAWDQLTAALEATASPSIATPRDDPRVAAVVEAGKAVVDRWDSPLWKDLPHTGTYVNELRAALSALEEKND